MEKEYHKYIYDGPVMEFDRLIDNHWYGETCAPTEKKAKTNLAYQYKKETNRIAGTRITLPGELEMVN